MNFDLTLAVLTCVFTWGAKAWFEFCTPEKTYTVSSKDCPAGVLFRKPQDIGTCYYPSGSGDHISDVCSEEQEVEEARKIQFIDSGNDEEDGPKSSNYESESCRDPFDIEPPEPGKCFSKRHRIDQSFVQEVSTLGTESGEAPFDPDSPDNVTETASDRVNINVKKQTYRLFLYLHGLVGPVQEELPTLRIVKLVRKSFSILHKHCDTQYVTQTFGKEILRAFLFLVRESNLARVKDINVHQYAKINQVLEKCLNKRPPYPFYLNGTVCPSNTKVYNIIKSDKKEGENTPVENSTHPIVKSSQFKFRWGKYDIPLDATWSVMDFVHGMCYGTFKEDMNSHHLYEQALERLFTPEIQYRWQRPARLNMESYWDHALRSHTNNMMNNLDACVQGAYLGNPYLHRLQRPFYKVVAPVEAKPETKATETTEPPSSRRKRSVDPSAQMWCLQNDQEKEEALNFVKGRCSAEQ